MRLDGARTADKSGVGLPPTKWVLGKAGAGPATSRHAPLLWLPPEVGACFAGWPHSVRSVRSCEATAASTWLHGSKAVLNHMASQANTNHRPQRFAVSLYISPQFPFTEFGARKLCMATAFYLAL